MLQNKLYTTLAGILLGSLLVAFIGWKFYSMNSDILKLEQDVAVKTVQLTEANKNTEQANRDIDRLAKINDEIIENVRKKQEDLTIEYERVNAANKITHEAETNALKRRVFLEKAKTRMSAIAKRKPKLLEKIIDSGNKRMFADIEQLTNLGA